MNIVRDDVTSMVTTAEQPVFVTVTTTYTTSLELFILKRKLAELERRINQLEKKIGDQ